MAATRAQKVGIWIIAIVLAAGTIGSFVAIIFANSNQQNDEARKQELTTAYQKEYEEYQAKVDAQAAALSAQYFAQFSQYNSLPSAFDKANVTELGKEDIVVGEGDEIKADSSFTAYYIGWNPDGKVFDSSIDGDKLKAPYTVDLSVPGGVIEGWREGAVGMRVGGVRLLTIPSDKAYGETGQGDDIPANTPLRFIVMVIPTPEQISEPQPSEELLKYYYGT